MQTLLLLLLEPCLPRSPLCLDGRPSGCTVLCCTVMYCTILCWQAEWLYSQSKGRQFSVGEQSKLVEFLMATCPLDPDQETDQDRKLNLILSKVQVSNDLKYLKLSLLNGHW